MVEKLSGQGTWETSPGCWSAGGQWITEGERGVCCVGDRGNARRPAYCGMRRPVRRTDSSFSLRHQILGCNGPGVSKNLVDWIFPLFGSAVSCAEICRPWRHRKTAHPIHSCGRRLVWVACLFIDLLGILVRPAPDVLGQCAGFDCGARVASRFARHPEFREGNFAWLFPDGCGGHRGTIFHCRGVNETALEMVGDFACGVSMCHLLVLASQFSIPTRTHLFACGFRISGK